MFETTFIITLSQCGDTPLTSAVSKENLDIAEILIDNGACIDYQKCGVCKLLSILM